MTTGTGAGAALRAVTDAAIARALIGAGKTVRTHGSAILAQLGPAGRTPAVSSYASRLGLSS